MDSYARYSALAFQMLVIILAGVWGGYQLDKWLNTGFPVFTLILSLVSVALAIYYAIRDFLSKK
ncbi:MAG: AtpZ/AtpI family protein [Bacteroidales bacterium]|nr:AtpZ/AtpI family protein [Bacteroidales bacterium]